MWKFMDYFSITSQIIIETAEKLWFKVEILNNKKNFFTIEWNWKKVYFKNNDFWWNSSLWYKIADDKELTNIILEQNWFRIPKSIYLKKEDLKDFDIKKTIFQYPLVVKPIDEWHWNWVTTNIKNEEELKYWIKKALEFWDNFIIQDFIKWDEHRILVIWEKVILWIKRIPAFVIWDWNYTIKELIEQENKNPLRWNWYEKPMTFIKIDDNLINFISKSWLTIDKIPNKDEYIKLRWISNIWVWWVPENITSELWNELKKECIEIAKILWLKVVWIDIITNDLSKSLKNSKWAIIEVNATPWFWWHKEIVWINSSLELLKYIFNI